MRTKHKWALGGLTALLLCGAALAQIAGLVPSSFTGNEVAVVAVNGPGSESEYATSGMFRNTTGGIIQSATTGTLTWPGNNATAQYSTIVYTGTSASVTQNLPAKPFDGQVVELVNGTSGNITLTTAVTDSATQTPSPCLSAVTVSANTSKQMYYLKSTTTWYLMR